MAFFGTFIFGLCNLAFFGASRLVLSFVSMTNRFTIKVAVITGASVLVIKLLSTLLVYHFLSFDIYLAIVAVAFLLAGMLLMPRLKKANGQPLMQQQVPGPLQRLTNRELAIFEMLGNSLTNKEISERLNIEISTVKSHVNSLYPKIECKNRIEAREKWKNYPVSQ